MPAMTNLLVKDDTAVTPVERTFLPISDSPPLWRTSIAGIPVSGQLRLTETLDKVRNGYKATVKLEVPVMEAVTATGTSLGYAAAPKVAYVVTGIFTMFYDDRSTTLDRANTLKMILGVLQGASATTATGVLSQTSAGSAVIDSSLPMPLSLVTGILPH